MNISHENHLHLTQTQLLHYYKQCTNSIKEKNKKHGPCRMTGNAVFGHSLFSDIEPIEFQSIFSTGIMDSVTHHFQTPWIPQKHKFGRIERVILLRWQTWEAMKVHGVVSVGAGAFIYDDKMQCWRGRVVGRGTYGSTHAPRWKMVGKKERSIPNLI